MTALAASRIPRRIACGATRVRVGKVAASTKIWKGAGVCRNLSGYVVPAANAAGFVFLGIAEETVDNTTGANGDLEVKYSTGLSVAFKNDGTAAVAQANLGGPVWIQDDQTVRGTPGAGVLVGFAESIESDGQVYVFIDPDGQGLARPYDIRYEHAAATADATHKLDKIPAGYKWRLLSADYVNPTGLAQHAANAFIIKVTKDGTVMASWSTITGAEGTLAADTFVTLTNSATDANLVAAADATIALFLDEQGDTTLPLGRIVLRGLLLPA